MVIILILWGMVAVNAEEVFENSTQICEKCMCDTGNAQILTLDCTNRRLKHMLSEWPQHNSTIRATFSDNDFRNLQRLPPTNAVVEVILSRCNITKLHSGLFDNTKNIILADLSHNMITAEEINPEKFMGPYRKENMIPIALKELNLAYNQIHTLNKDLFKYLPHLERLNLEGNDFVVLDLPTQLALSSVPKLLLLNLANNGLTDLVEGAIIAYTSLVELNLSKNQLDFMPSCLKDLGKSLETLTLDDNPIIELKIETLSSLVGLTALSANNLTKLKHVKHGTFAQMAKLTRLSLSNNLLLEDIEEGAFSMNQTIEELYLNNNNMTYLHYHLLSWPRLKTFEFKENPLQCNCDLYKITTLLSSDITLTPDGPYCTHPNTGRPIQVYNIKNDICSAQPRRESPKAIDRHYSKRFQKEVEKIQQSIQHHHSILMIMMVILTVTVVIGAAAGALLGGNRRLKSRNHHYTYKQVLENKC